MQRFWLGLAVATAISACSGGDPYADDDDSTDPEAPGGIPDDLLGDLETISYDPTAQTLTVSGISLDDTPFTTVYTRKPGLDIDGYQAYTAQDSSLDRHNTAYVQQIDGAYAGIVVSGGQFGSYFGGSTYGRTGTYSAPTGETPSGGLVSYAGTYVGLLNVSGDGGDLLPVDPGTPAEVRPRQAAEVSGDIFINADFVDNAVNGIIYNRVVVDAATGVEDIELFPADIAADGTFVGEAKQDGGSDTVGDFGGLFGGTGATAVAGTIYVQDHIDAFDNEEERGVFVLSQCGVPGADPVCTQPVP